MGGGQSLLPDESSSQKDAWDIIEEYLDNPPSFHVDLTQQIKQLSTNPNNFIKAPTQQPQPEQLNEKYVGVATKLLLLDPNLPAVRHKLVPARVKENHFWRNYFYHLFTLASAHGILLLPGPEQPIPLNYVYERAIAIEAVTKACRVCQVVLNTLVGSDALTKRDKSLVALLSCQAVINLELKRSFSSDVIVAEQPSEEITDKKELISKVVTLTNSVFPPPAVGEDEILSAIRVQSPHERPDRFWILDPIDGILGFLRGGQFAVCLALIVQSQVVVGVLGCPNLLVNPSNLDGPRGVIFSALKGHGATSRAISGGGVDRPIKVSDLTDPKNARFTESIEPHHSHDQSFQVGKVLGTTNRSVQMDSQCKYAAVARGDADVFFRLPSTSITSSSSSNQKTEIWDHASGYLLVKEAGGEVTDIKGNDLDFSLGRTLANNKGIVATNGKFHQTVLDTIKYVISPPTKTFSLTITQNNESENYSRQTPSTIKRALSTSLNISSELIEVVEGFGKGS